MEYTEKIRDVLLRLYPVRKNLTQKSDFREWLLRELRRSGWRAAEERYGKTNGSVNVVAGDPDRAAVFLTARYDTASRMAVPDFVSPTNVAAHVLYHALAALGLVALALLASFAVSFPLDLPGLMLPLFLILLLVLLFFAAFGPSNPSNANGNTSGVLALLAIAKAVPRDKRVCLVFFDNNAKNLLGAGAFKKAHPNAAQSCLFLNFDCVGDGEHLLLMPSRSCRWDEKLLAALEEGFGDTEGLSVHLLTKGLNYYPSDHRRFKFHVAAAACHHIGGLGYCIPHLRTKRDTVLQVENIDCIAEGIARFLPLYLESGGDTQD